MLEFGVQGAKREATTTDAGLLRRRLIGGWGEVLWLDACLFQQRSGSGLRQVYQHGEAASVELPGLGVAQRPADMVPTLHPIHGGD